MPLWKFQEAATPSSGEFTELTDFSLDLSTYYQSYSGENFILDLETWATDRDDLPMFLQAAIFGSGELVFNLGAYYQSYGTSGEVLSLDLGTVEGSWEMLPTYLAAFLKGSGELPFDLEIVAQELESFYNDLSAAGDEREDFTCDFETVEGDNLTDMPMFLEATDGIVCTDMVMDLRVIGKIPVFQKTYAHRISSVKHEIL
jgi:hypothetical protein